jgi:hypothetical protein
LTFTTYRSFDLMTLDPRRSLVKAMRLESGDHTASWSPRPMRVGGVSL